MAKTKILATIGPASIDKIEQLVLAGLDGMRINMSHIKPGDYDTWREIIKRAKGLNENLFCVADLEGPKIRLGDFETIKVKKGDIIGIVPASLYQSDGVPVQFEDLYQYVTKGDLLLVDDGNVGLRVKGIEEKNILCLVEYGENLEKRKGVNLRNVKIPISYIDEKAKSQLEFIASSDVDFVSVSYTRTPQDVKDVDSYIKGCKTKKIAKPETQEGIDNFDGILKEVDAAMVPRGDLGMEIGVIKVPAYQKMMIRKCNLAGKPVITATQMMESMMETMEPKRAEVSDVFNAVLDGTDIVMLSGETSKGKYPIETVRVMSSIVKEAEGYMFNGCEARLSDSLDRLIEANNPADSVCKAVYTASKAKYISAIVIPTSTGYTARMVARFRIDKPIFAVTYDENVKRQLNAVFGVVPLLTNYKPDSDLVENAIRVAKEKGYLNVGESVIVTGGIGSSGNRSTNLMRIEKVN